MEALIPSDVGPAELIAGLTSENLRLAALAATGLGERGPESRVAVRHLLELLLADDRNETSLQLRLSVQIALRRIEHCVPDPMVIDQLIEDLRSQNSLQTARSLVLLGGAEFIAHASVVIPALQTRLKTLRTPLRRLGLDTLGEFGSPAAETLIERLQHDDELRWDAAENLSRITRIDAQLLEAAYEGSDDEGRMTLLSLFGRTNTFDAGAVLALVKRGLADDDAGIRLEATSAVDQYAEELAPLVDDFIFALQREHEEQSLGLRSIEAGMDEVTYYVDDFAEALGRFGRAATRAIPSLIPLLDDLDDGVRDAAFCAILRIGPNSRELDRLFEIYRSRESGARFEWTALLAAHLNVQHATGMVMGWLVDDDPRSIEAAAQLLAEAGEGGREAVPNLVRAISHADKPAHLAILRAIGQLGETPGSLPALLAAIQEDDDDVRNEAVSAILRLRCRAPNAVFELLETRDSLGSRGRLAVAVAVCQLSHTNAQRVIQQLLDLLEVCEHESEMNSDAERWLTAIGRPAAALIWERLFAGRLGVDEALDLLEHRAFELVPEELAPIALKLLRSKSSRLRFAGADVARRFPLSGQHPEIASCLWKLVGSEEHAIRCYAADALVRMAEGMPDSGFRIDLPQPWE